MDTGRAFRVMLAVLVISVSIQACNQHVPEKKSEKIAEQHLVETVTIKKDTLSHVSTHTGTLRASRTIRIFNREEGQIKQIPFYEGDMVNKGSVLVELDDQLLRAELGKAIATHRQAELDLKRLTDMLNKQLVSNEEKARVQTALEVAQSEEKVLETRLAFTTIKAPFSGMINERLLESGDIVPRHTHLLSLYDPGSLVTEISMSELMLPFVNQGDQVEVKIDALGNKTFSGLIKCIHPSLDERTRRSLVEVSIDPVPRGAMIGQFCRVVLNTQAQDCLVVPFSALQRDGKGEYLFVVEEGEVKKINVRSGLRLADKVEIIDGVADGSKIVLKGFLGLREGKKVKEVPLQQSLQRSSLKEDK
ncbi:MAG: efflux RND transporter periplasmic adaptor subunit [Gammaproteobacteria bacterium]|nr:efflux RND transporter periplasmic adaptor subunit [Gammaproteobacteria bacterium]